ncbi:MAG: hypothetical protein WCK01_05800 [Candidatus Uhrbacteria bacterium]
MSFHDRLAEINALLNDYHNIVDAERGYWGKITRDTPPLLSNGELFSRQKFPGSRTELEMRFSFTNPEASPHFSVSLSFWKKEDPEIVLGGVMLRSEPFREEGFGMCMKWEVGAFRLPPRKLPRGAERLVTRLRRQLRTKEPIAYKERHQQLVSTMFRYATEGPRF